MKVYTTDKIRNVVLLGHGGCGKTSLAEAMAYLGGITSRIGKVTDGNTVSDYGKEEQKRHFSISTSMIPIEWEDTKINILDTPGYFDFVGEVEEAVSAADAAIIGYRCFHAYPEPVQIRRCPCGGESLPLYHRQHRSLPESPPSGQIHRIRHTCHKLQALH